MKKPNYLLSLIILFLFIGISCKKKEIPYYELDPVFLSYFAFPQGSWWTYKEVNSGKTDSFYVNNYIKEIFLNKKEEDIRYERLHYHILSKNYTAYGHARPTYNLKRDALLYLYEEDFDYGSNNISGSSFRIIYPFEEDETFNGYFNMRKHIDTITINNILYRDVIKAESTKRAYNNPIKSEFFCRNIGIIKRELFDGTVWELINYHINK